MADYRRTYGCARAWVAYHKRQRPVAVALDVVASWRDREGKVYAHQARVPRRAKVEAGNRIRALDLAGVRTFDDLFHRVQDAIGSVRGIGDLAVYDAATRIGASLGVWPEQVYVHAGVRQGARALGLDANRRSLPVNAFPPELRRLDPWQIEDVLCIYKDQLPRMARQSGQVSRGTA
ncbi:MAG TPA: hypothetical protein VFM30_10330 [Steroidobacteraceae bacterium]|nr:hypothetical protein [Steroidobacteraceae bacterium]